MSRNNPERLGANVHDAGATPPNVQQESENSFSFVVPTEFVELPSKGRYYPPGHPLNGQQHIEIRHMTAKEEDILTSRTLLKQGVALDRVLKNIIVDRQINLDSLLVGDKNAIVIAARVSAYGSEYRTAVTCPSCGETSKYSFSLQEASIFEGDPSNPLDVRSTESGTFMVQLPVTGVTVEFKLLTGIDEKLLTRGIEMDRKSKSGERNITRQLKALALSVNGSNNPNDINNFVDNMPSMDARQLRLAHKLVSPNVDLTQDFVCPSCGHEQEMEVPLTADFFWPDR